MAALVLYVSLDSTQLVEASPGAEAYASGPTGWIVSTGAGVDYSEYAQLVERAAATFGATVRPDGGLDGTLFDFVSFNTKKTGDFASANWVFNFAVRAQTNGGAHDGAVLIRLFRCTGFNGGGIATEVTSAAQTGTTVTNLATSATQKSTVTFNPGAFSLADECVVLQIGWKRLGAGGMTSSDVNLRVGDASSILTTADFTPTTPAQSQAPRTMHQSRLRHN